MDRLYATRGWLVIALVVIIVGGLLAWGVQVHVFIPADPVPPAAADSEKTLFNFGFGFLGRYTDSDAQVVCYVYKSGYAGGISCLPMSQTTLPKE